MFEIITYHPGFSKYLLKRQDGVQFYCSLKVLNHMLRLNLIL